MPLIITLLARFCQDTNRLGGLNKPNERTAAKEMLEAVLHEIFKHGGVELHMVLGNDAQLHSSGVITGHTSFIVPIDAEGKADLS